MRHFGERGGICPPVRCIRRRTGGLTSPRSLVLFVAARGDARGDVTLAEILHPRKPDVIRRLLSMPLMALSRSIHARSIGAFAKEASAIHPAIKLATL